MIQGIGSGWFFGVTSSRFPTDATMIDNQLLALAMGYLASICFTIQYFPQARLNFQKKSVYGFSSGGIIIKLIGACFLASNSFYTDQSPSVIAYGFLNVFQHQIFMAQY